MNEEIEKLRENLFDKRVIPVSQEELGKVTGKKGSYLGAIKIDENAYKILLPENPLEILEEDVVKYMGHRTASKTRDDLVFLLHTYAIFHEEGHILHKDEIENERENIKQLKDAKENDPTGILEKIYVTALIINARDYLAGKEEAIRLAETFPEIKKEAKLLKNYLENRKYGMRS